MTERLLNDELLLRYPEGFHELSEAERRGMNLMEDGQWLGISDPERHILITVGWKQLGGFSSMLLKERDLAKNMEKQIRRSMQSFGFRPDGRKERRIDDMNACGFGYEYVAQGIQMYAESYAAKKDRFVYYFHFYARNALKAESLSVWKDILDQMMNAASGSA